MKPSLPPTLATAYALARVGASDLDASPAHVAAAAAGNDTREMTETFATLYAALVVVDGRHPDLGIRADLDRLGTLLEADDLVAFADGFSATVARARPYMLVEA